MRQQTDAVEYVKEYYVKSLVDKSRLVVSLIGNVGLNSLNNVNIKLNNYIFILFKKQTTFPFTFFV